VLNILSWALYMLLRSMNTKHLDKLVETRDFVYTCTSFSDSRTCTTTCIYMSSYISESMTFPSIPLRHTNLSWLFEYYIFRIHEPNTKLVSTHQKTARRVLGRMGGINTGSMLLFFNKSLSFVFGNRERHHPQSRSLTTSQLRR